ncbi:MAG: hypothetical protein K0A94_02630 [Desulfuromonadales bacterium]|nr:hypothetical protein [Desulfuromonadales bacterium]
MESLAKLRTVAVVGILGLVVFCFLFLGASHAETPLKPSANQMQIQKKEPVSIPATIKPLSTLPDLTVKTPSWSSAPKAGDTVGMSSSLHITMLNQGSAPTPVMDSKLKITCQSLSGAACPGALTGIISVQPLAPGMSVTYAWPPASPSEKWAPGKYQMTFTADASMQVQESNETNNTSQLIFTILPGLNIQQGTLDSTKVQRAPSVAAAIIAAIPVQHPLQGSTHDAGKPLQIRWSKTLLSNYATVDIHLLGGNDGKLFETIKKGAVNSGEYIAWTAPQKYAGPGSVYKVQIVTPDQKISGHSGIFSIHIPSKKKVPFMVDATISNSWAYARGGDLSPADCMSAPQIQAGRPPGSQEVKIGHFVKSGKHGDCGYYDKYYFRSRVYFDMSFYKDKEIVEAALMIRMGDTIDLIPGSNEAKHATNVEISSHCDIYLLNGSWPNSPQPLYNFYPGTFLKNFSMSAQGETVNVELLSVVKDWTAGKANHGLMLRGPLNQSKYSNSASVKYYHSVKLVGWYLE